MPVQGKVAGLALLAALIAACAWVFLRRESPDERYRQAVARVCERSEQALEDANPGLYMNQSYFENVSTISEVKIDGLSKIKPPPERRRLHAYLLGAERELERESLAVDLSSRQSMITSFRPLMAKQKALDNWYRTLDIKSCSD